MIPCRGRDHFHGGSKRFDSSKLLGREGIRGDDVQGVSGQGANECQRTSGAAAGVLDNRLTGCQPPVLLGPSNHGQRHPILVRTGGIATFELHPDLSPARAWRQLDQRGVADRIEKAHAFDASQGGATRTRRCESPWGWLPSPSVIRKVLVANRGEIARRIFRTCRSMGIGTVAVFSEVDRRAPFVPEADEAFSIGGTAPSESYLSH